ncbi:MAG TPA: hypothetical protein VHR66_02905 [Gemmataceae bacterium]|jgi:outer membrane lipoprotein-sorting protein|nr:hypothetical protein [Gemmataceae bacterium]
MKRIAIALGLLLMLPVASYADSNQEAIAIVDKAIAASGGAEALAKMKGATWKAKGKLDFNGMAITYTADYAFAYPDKLRFDIDMDAGGMKVKFASATNGKDAWQQSGDQFEVMTKEKGVEFDHNVYVMQISQLLPLKDKVYTLTSLGESKVGDQPVMGIKVARGGRREVSLYFDKKTGLLAKSSTRVVAELTMKEVTQDVLVSDYRDKDGAKIFGKLTILHDGKEYIVEEMSDYKVMEKVDDKVFAKPAGK